MIKALLVDDERLARIEMRQVLAELAEQIEVIGEAESKDEAIAFLASEKNPRPDVIFLDINMPDGSGFDMIEELDNQPSMQHATLIPIVFVTAYDEFAVRAFSVNALDYVLKPIDPYRLRQTVARLQEKIRLQALLEQSLPEQLSFEQTSSEQATQRISVEKSTIPSLDDDEAQNDNEQVDDEQMSDEQIEEIESLTTLTIEDYVYVTIEKRRRFIPLTEIMYITSGDNYSELYFAKGERAMLLRTMNEWEIILPAEEFVRIHRSTIINRSFLDPSRPMKQHGRSMVVFLKTLDEPFIISRRMYAKWKEQK